MTEKIHGSFKAQAANSHETGVKKTDLYKVPPEKLVEEPGFNERDYSDPDVQTQIEAFAQAFAAGRYVPPLVVRIDPITGDIIVVDGHQRRRGALLAIERGATITHLECLPFRGNDADRVICMLTSSEGLKLKPVGIARGYLRLLNMGSDVQEIARSVAKTPQHVESMLVLAEANSDVQALVNKGAVSATMAIEVVRKHGDKAGAILGSKLQEANARGQTKVKPSAIKDWAPPRALATKLYHSVGSALGQITQSSEVQQLLADLEANGSDAAAGKTVPVNAAALIELMRLFKETEEARTKKSEPKKDEQPED
ncbi:ParB/RepB/Spo0J family partition protein [Alicycliphilus denitrificans]|uniref:ParB/RepB/Spo0J family partition protein n=1 Tax=Alicycliphilus denitrificans TaxID=179636 RepID=UPI0001D9E91D|nr:hypothetical protein [Alicycliphilus denitrificans]ADV02155.1 hypothetical protein Alide_4553 [Alicycliphilus denitrificans BC]